MSAQRCRDCHWFSPGTFRYRHDLGLCEWGERHAQAPRAFKSQTAPITVDDFADNCPQFARADRAPLRA